MHLKLGVAGAGGGGGGQGVGGGQGGAASGKVCAVQGPSYGSDGEQVAAHTFPTAAECAAACEALAQCAPRVAPGLVERGLVGRSRLDHAK